MKFLLSYKYLIYAFRKIRLIQIVFLLSFIVSFFNCAQQDLVDKAEAYNEIYFALKYKTNECNVEIPRLPLILDEQVSRRNLDLCTIAITGASCTTIDYPLPCLLLYFKKDSGEIPWFLNFKELSNSKVNL